MQNTKKAALAAIAGTTMMFGGCINWEQLLISAATTSAIEFVLDNDNIFDLFEDGGAAAAE